MARRALRPDNAPICPLIDASSRFTSVAPRGSGRLVVGSRATPMAIVAEYARAIVHPNGCGGVETAGKMYVNAGGGSAANPLESDLCAFPLAGFSTTPNPPNTPAPTLVFSHDDCGFVDSNGEKLTGMAASCGSPTGRPTASWWWKRQATGWSTRSAWSPR